MTSVLLISTAANIGGMERVVCSLSRGLSARGWDVRTVFPECDDAHSLLAWCTEQGVDAETHPAVTEAAAAHSWRTSAALRELVREYDPDVVNLHYGDNFLSLWDAIGVRLSGRRVAVASIHHPTPWTRDSRRKRAMTAIGARLVHGVTTFAGATRDIISDAGVPTSRIAVIPCGVRVPVEPADRSAARPLLGVSPDAFVVGTLARLVGYKGIDVLIDALDCPELEGTVLLVGGDGPARSALEAHAESCVHVDARFLGRIPRIDDLFASLDVFALPSELEGFGLVYVEAAMYGVPSVATSVGGVPDAVDDGVTGVLVEPGDADAIRHELIAMRKDPEHRRRLGNAARHRAVHELDENTMVRRFDTLFRRLERSPSGRGRRRALMYHGSGNG